MKFCENNNSENEIIIKIYNNGSKMMIIIIIKPYRSSQPSLKGCRIVRGRGFGNPFYLFVIKTINKLVLK